MMTTDVAQRGIERRLASMIPYYSTSSYAPSSCPVVDKASVALEASKIMIQLKSVLRDDVGVARTYCVLECAVSELWVM